MILTRLKKKTLGGKLLNLKKPDNYQVKHWPLWLVILSLVCALGMFAASIFLAAHNNYAFFSWSGFVDFGITVFFGLAFFFGMIQLIWRIQDR